MVNLNNLQLPRQFALEAEAIACGKQRLQESINKLEQKSYASASVYGVASIREALPVLVKQIEATRWRMPKRQAGKFYKPIAQYLDELEPLAIATIILKVTFDKVFSTPDSKHADKLTSILQPVGAALETECKFRW